MGGEKDQTDGDTSNDRNDDTYLDHGHNRILSVGELANGMTLAAYEIERKPKTANSRRIVGRFRRHVIFSKGHVGWYPWLHKIVTCASDCTPTAHGLSRVFSV